MQDTKFATILAVEHRYNYFQGREERWLRFVSEKPTIMEVNHRHSYIGGLSDGIYFFGELGDQNEGIFARGLRYYRLPRCRHEESVPLQAAHCSTWEAIDFEGKEALALGLSLENANLLAILHLVDL